MSDKENRDLDKKTSIIPEKGTAPRSIMHSGVSLEVIKSNFIASGMTAEEIADQLYLPLSRVQEVIETHNLVELRKAYIIEGISKIQNVQLNQSQKLMGLENDFKKLRIIQLEKQLEDYLAYFARHGDFYKRHPTTGDILKNTDGIPMQIKLPNVSRELAQLKESVTMSEGVRMLLNRLDEIINTKKPTESVIPGEDDIIDVSNYKHLLDSGD
jgi:hypothetical protein